MQVQYHYNYFVLAFCVCGLGNIKEIVEKMWTDIEQTLDNLKSNIFIEAARIKEPLSTTFSSNKSQNRTSLVFLGYKNIVKFVRDTNIKAFPDFL